MVAPHKTSVSPLVRTADTQVALRLDDMFKVWLSRGRTEPFVICGASGSGKTKALEYLRPLLEEAGYQSFDEPRSGMSATARVALTSAESTEMQPGSYCQLEPWSDDEVLEWLMAERPEHCASVMRRLHESAEQRWIEGNPRLWVVCLERMADDEGLSGPLAAVDAVLEEVFVSREHARLIDGMLSAAEEAGSIDLIRWLPSIAERGAHGAILSHRMVHRVLLAELLVEILVTGRGSKFVEGSIDADVYELAARRVATQPDLRDLIRERLLSKSRRLASVDMHQAAACSVLVRSMPSWRPRAAMLKNIEGAQLQGVDWDGVRIPKCALDGVDFSAASLRSADLSGSDAFGMIAEGANFRLADLEGVNAGRAKCRGIKMVSVHAVESTWREADLRGADCGKSEFMGACFSGADLRETKWHRANLMNADLSGSQLDGANFLDAILAQVVMARLDLRRVRFDGASLVGAVLYRSNLESVCALGVDFSRAGAMESLWTNSFLRDCQLVGINLRGARLAGADWEGVDLRDADLSRVSFHTGTSRSGLIDSMTAGEGSRTGFYTDEHRDLNFHAPEDVRAANLCDADLRGARLDDTDFYLVDLRGAKLDSSQHEYLSRSGAILS